MDANTKPRTAFQRYLEQMGDDRAAALFRVKKRAVQAWRLGARRPRTAKAREIVQVAPVSLDEIYQ